MTEKSAAYRQIIRDLYDHIQADWYLNRRDMEIDGTRYNSTLLLSLLTALAQGRELIIGEPGMGKTTSAEYICSLLYRIPLGIVWRAVVSGHPEQTEEKIIGRPDLGKLNRGEEAVIWSYFSMLPAKIVDEINRLPETKQSVILDGIDRGKWEYLNSSIINEEFCLFATANYQDRGSHTIIAPLLDRFDVMVESKHPGANMAYQIGMRPANGNILRDERFEAEIEEVLNGSAPYREKTPQLERICDQYAEHVSTETGIRTLSRLDRDHIRAQMALLPFDLDANAFLRMVLAELSFCYRFGQKRSHEVCEEGCHFSGYLCHLTGACISNRFPMSVRNYSQALAWLLGEDQVRLETLKTILPYALAHRLVWKDDVIARWDDEPRSDPLPIFLAKKAVARMHESYIEQGPRIKKALAAAFRIANGESVEPVEGDHPIFWEIRRDLNEGGAAR